MSRVKRRTRPLAVVGLAVLISSLTGCALYQSDPVPAPPPPPESVALDRGNAPDELDRWLERNDSGEVTAFLPLRRARTAVEEAAAADEVAEHAPDKLEQAQSTLDGAEEKWRAIGDAPLDQPRALAEAAHAAHQAERWARIALAVGERESGLRRLASVQSELEKRDAADARWVGTQLVPGEFGDVRFAAGTARLTEESGAVVARLAEFMRAHPRYALRLIGHTDDRPPSQASLEEFLSANPEVARRARDASARASAYNQAMSERRARALRRALIDAGVAPERLHAEGRGAGQPVADNDTAAGRRQNRRVEVIVVLPSGAA